MPTTGQVGLIPSGGVWGYAATVDPLADQSTHFFYGSSVLSSGVVGDGVTDDTAAIQRSINTNAGRTVYFPKPAVAYLVSATITVPAGTTLAFDDATFKANAGVATGIFAVSTVDVTITGKVLYNAASFATPFVSGTLGGDRLDASNIHATITNAATAPSTNNYLFRVLQCNGVRIGGYITTTGNSPWLVYVDRGSNVEVFGVKTPALTVTAGNFSPVQVCESTGASSLQDVSVHNCFINGGGVLAGTYPGIMVGTLTTAITTSFVSINNCIVTNTLSTSDGIDVVLTQYATVTNCLFSACNDGISVSATNVATVTNCVATGCRGAGFAAGDASITANTNGVTFTNCQAWNCGTGATGGGYFVFAPNTFTTNAIHFENCLANCPTAQFEIQITGNGGGVTDVTINGGSFSGGTVGHINDTIGSAAAPIYRVRNARNINPGGIRTQPAAVPASGVAQANTTGYDCTVIVYTGAGVTVTQITIGGQITNMSIAASSFLQVRVTAAQTIALTYAGGTPTWGWIGD